jgi:catechol 2,3-dioxygenase
LKSARARLFALISLVVLIVAAVVAGIVLAVGGSSQGVDAEVDAGSVNGGSAASGGAGAPESVLPVDTSMGEVELNVRDLASMRDFYVGAVGLEVLHEGGGAIELGLDEPLILLRESSDGSVSATPTEAGLYHSAILYPDAESLARVLLNIATVAPERYQGSADHAVSEAFYFVDPEGNGLELYIDRPASEWVWVDGEVQMGSAALDPNAFIAEHLGSSAGAGVGENGPGVSASDALMGHVHLKVGDLAEAEAFYADTLGFAVTARSDGAIFYSAGGYHHHLATNTWQSGQAGARSNSTGLGAFVVVLPGEESLDSLRDRLDEARVPYEAVDDVLAFDDPWGNEVRAVVDA